MLTGTWSTLAVWTIKERNLGLYIAKATMKSQKSTPGMDSNERCSFKLTLLGDKKLKSPVVVQLQVVLTDVVKLRTGPACRPVSDVFGVIVVDPEPPPHTASYANSGHCSSSRTST